MSSLFLSTPMSEEETASQSSSAPTTIVAPESSTSSATTSTSKVDSSIQALSQILPSIPHSLSTSSALLHDSDTVSQITSLLHQTDAGAGDNQLCRWLYDTFHSSDPNLQLVVVRFIPTICGVYLSRVALRKALTGFEAVLLALYAHETNSRAGQAVTVNVPDLSNSSLYHESNKANKNNTSSTELNLAVISPSLEPHGIVRSTRRARIVGVALELYYSRISLMPVSSKVEFCEFCVLWSGQDGHYNNNPNEDNKDGDNENDRSENTDDTDDDNGKAMVVKQEDRKVRKEKKEGRIHLSWELLQPMLRVLSHCLLGPKKDKVLYDAAMAACRSLNERALHDVKPKAILATESLLRLGNVGFDSINDDDAFDHTEIPKTSVISL